MPHSCTNLLFHVVFATRYRQPCFTEQLRPVLCKQLGVILQDLEAQPLRLNGVCDHVHLLVKLKPTQAVAKVVSAVKAQACRWLHRTQPDLAHFHWQTGYGAFTVSQSQAAVVARYIDNQEEHHRRMPFDREYRELLQRHGFEAPEELTWE